MQPGGRFPELLEELLERNRDAIAGVGVQPGQLENLLNQRLQTVAFAPQARPQHFAFLGCGAFGQSQRDAQASQWRAQLVRHVAQQLALAADQALQACAHAVEVARQRAQLIAATR